MVQASPQVNFIIFLSVCFNQRHFRSTLALSTFIAGLGLEEVLFLPSFFCMCKSLFDFYLNSVQGVPLSVLYQGVSE